MKLAYPVATPEVHAGILGAAGAVPDTLFTLRDLGYQAIEPFVADPSAFDSQAWIRAVQQSGLAVAAVGTGPVVSDHQLTFTHPEPGLRRAAIDRAKSIVEFAAQLGTQVNIGKLRGDIAADNAVESRTWMETAFVEVCSHAAASGVMITLEPQNRNVVNNLNTTTEALDWLCRMGLPNLRLMLDVFHMDRMGEDLASSFTAAREVLLHVHYADSDRQVPGAGSLDFRSITRELRAIGYNRTITVEINQQPDMLEAARSSATFLLPLIA